MKHVKNGQFSQIRVKSCQLKSNGIEMGRKFLVPLEQEREWKRICKHFSMRFFLQDGSMKGSTFVFRKNCYLWKKNKIFMAFLITKRNANLSSFRTRNGVQRQFLTFFNGIFCAGRLNERKDIRFRKKC